MNKSLNERVNNCIKLINQGEESGVQHLLECFSPRLYYVGNKYFRSQEDVKDFVQEFWSRIQRYASKCTHLDNGLNYLLKCAENLARNMYGKNKKINSYELNLDLDCMYGFTDSKDCIERSESAEIVEKVLSELDQKEKYVIFELYFSEKSIRQVAKEMGVSKSTVDYLKQKALKKFEKFI